MDRPPPRITPLAQDELTEEMRELLNLPRHGFGVLGASDYLSTLVRHPGLYRRYAAFAGKLLMAGKLAARDRELAILRNAWLCQAPFEWGEHVEIAHEVGLTSQEVEQIVVGPQHASWNDHDRAILSAVDELHGTATISEGLWAALEKDLDAKQLIELLMVIGAYQMIAYVQNALRIELREGNTGLAAR